MFRHKAKEVAYLVYNDDLKGEQQFSIPNKSKLLITEAQANSLCLKKRDAKSTLSISVDNYDINRESFSVKGDEKSVRELYAVLKNSGLIVVYTANNQHQVIADDDSLIKFIKDQAKAIIRDERYQLRDFNLVKSHEHKRTLAKRYELEKALLTAADKCDAKKITQILSEAAEMNIKITINSVRNSRNETLLMLAASGNRKIPHGQSYEAVQCLLQAGADPLLTSNDGRTALMEAANFGRVSVVNLLINSVPSNERLTYIIQTDDVGTTAKDYAGQKGHFVDVHAKIGKILDDRIAETKDEVVNLKSSP